MFGLLDFVLWVCGVAGFYLCLALIWFCLVVYCFFVLVSVSEFVWLSICLFLGFVVFVCLFSVASGVVGVCLVWFGLGLGVCVWLVTRICCLCCCFYVWVL